MADNDLNSSAFPRLDEEQMACLARCPLSALERYQAGQTLIRAGDRDSSSSSSSRAKSRSWTPATSPTVVVHGPGRVHRRRGAPDRQPGDRQCGRPG